MDQSEKIEFLGGQVHALVGFAHAVIASHPNLAVLAQHLDEIGKVNLATAETAAVREEYVLVLEVAIAKRVDLHPLEGTIITCGLQFQSRASILRTFSRSTESKNRKTPSH